MRSSERAARLVGRHLRCATRAGAAIALAAAVASPGVPAPPAAAAFGAMTPLEELFWSNGVQLPQARRNAGVVAADNGSIFLIGGSANNSSPLYASVIDLTPGATSWVTRPSLSVARASLRAVQLPDGRSYAVGGGTSGTISSRVVERYEPDNPGWVRVAELPSGRIARAAA